MTNIFKVIFLLFISFHLSGQCAAEYNDENNNWAQCFTEDLNIAINADYINHICVGQSGTTVALSTLLAANNGFPSQSVPPPYSPTATNNPYAGFHFIEGSILIDVDYVFENDIFIFVKDPSYNGVQNGNFIVKEGVNVTFDNCYMASCDYFWGGIFLQNNSSLTLKNNTKIIKSSRAVYGQGTVNIDVDETEFRDNISGIHLTNLTSASSVNVSNSTFDIIFADLVPNGQDCYPIYLENCSITTNVTNSNVKNYFDYVIGNAIIYEARGITAKQSNLDIIDSEFENNEFSVIGINDGSYNQFLSVTGEKTNFYNCRVDIVSDNCHLNVKDVNSEKKTAPLLQFDSDVRFVRSLNNENKEITISNTIISSELPFYSGIEVRQSNYSPTIINFNKITFLNGTALEVRRTKNSDISINDNRIFTLAGGAGISTSSNDYSTVNVFENSLIFNPTVTQPEYFYDGISFFQGIETTNICINNNLSSNIVNINPLDPDLQPSVNAITLESSNNVELGCNTIFQHHLGVNFLGYLDNIDFHDNTITESNIGIRIGWQAYVNGMLLIDFPGSIGDQINNNNTWNGPFIQYGALCTNNPGPDESTFTVSSSNPPLYPLPNNYPINSWFYITGTESPENCVNPTTNFSLKGSKDEEFARSSDEEIRSMDLIKDYKDRIFSANVQTDKTESTLDIFPNPATDLFNVKSNMEIKEISVYNVSGQIVKSVKDVNKKDCQIEIGNLSNGIYFVKIKGADGIISKSFVKQ